MASCDKATDEEELIFDSKKERILLLAAERGWGFIEFFYLEGVLEQLGMMTAWYSYGNGDICIKKSKLWNALDSQIIISMINTIIHPILKIRVKNQGQFPDVLWFEQDNC